MGIRWRVVSGWWWLESFVCGWSGIYIATEVSVWGEVDWLFPLFSLFLLDWL